MDRLFLVAFMQCSRCGVCCEKTEMLLSEADMARLKKAGYDPKGFMHVNCDGFVRLRNRGGYCVFYDCAGRHCRVYGLRPLGCRIYPVIYCEDEGVVVDNLCPMSWTVSRTQIKAETPKLLRLLRRIDSEAETRRRNVKL